MNGNRVTFDEIYNRANEFLRKYPLNIAWRIKQHCKVLANHINDDEKIFFILPAQKNTSSFDIFSTVVMAFTNKRILMAQKNVLWGYSLFSITPDMFNDFEVYKALIFGRVDIDTVKEVVKLSNIDPKALVEIETNLSEYLLKIKPGYKKKHHDKDENSETEQKN